MLRIRSRRDRTTTYTLLLAGAGGLAACTHGTAGPASTPPPPAPAAPMVGAASEAAGRIALGHDPRDGEDVLSEALAMNGKDKAAPPRDFRRGNVTKAKAVPVVQPSKGRFEVALPSGAPVVTPTVYDGTVLVSGGFHSREYYAFHTKTGAPVWGIEVDDDGPSTAACESRICVFNTESCTIFSVSVDTGEQLWSWFLGDPLMSSPTVSGGRVFTSYPAAGTAPPDDGAEPKPHPGASHAFAAFDLRTGAILWQKWIDADVMSAPVAAGDSIYAATFAGTIYEFDQATGEIRAAKARRATSAPVVDTDGLHYTRRADALGAPAGAAAEAVVVERGVPFLPGAAGVPGGGSGGRPLLIGLGPLLQAIGPVLLAGGPEEQHRKAAPYLDRSVQASSAYQFASESLDAGNGFANGAPASANAGVAMGLVGQGNVSSLQAFQGSRVLRFGALSVNSMGDEILALDDEGNKRWSVKVEGDLAAAGGFLATPPAAAGGRIVVGTLQGELLTIDPTSGSELARYDVKHPIRAQPVVHDGWIYVGTVDGKLIAVDTGDASLTGWPMWGRDAQRSGRM